MLKQNKPNLVYSTLSRDFFPHTLQIYETLILIEPNAFLTVRQPQIETSCKNPHWSLGMITDVLNKRFRLHVGETSSH